MSDFNHQNRWKSLQFFGDNKIALSREIHNHPELLELLSDHHPDDWEVKLAHIAVYCEVILDGDYLENQIEQLCGILTEKLITKRTGFVFPKEIVKEDKKEN